MKLINRCARKDWYAFWRKCRMNGYDFISQPGDALADKQAFIDEIKKYAVDGKVRLCERFMDCDHAISTSSSLVPANLYAVTKVIDDIYDNAEGTGSTWLDFPANKPEADSRDLALEAFEDGHPHSISEVRYETH